MSHSRSSSSSSSRNTSPSRSARKVRRSSATSSNESSSESFIPLSSSPPPTFVSKRQQKLLKKNKFNTYNTQDNFSLQQNNTLHANNHNHKTNNNNNNSNSDNKNHLESGGSKNKVVPFYSVSSVGGLVDEDCTRLQQRAARFSQTSCGQNKRTGLSSVCNMGSVAQGRNMKKINSRIFVDESPMLANHAGIDLIDLHIIGTCLDLEKSFLRLTKAPLPSEVRPLEVLLQSLENVKTKWRNNQDYFYACDQLKSIRQDLTVI